MSGDRDIFIGRQPILDRHGRVAAYELLFRDSATATFASIDDYDVAAVRVIVNTFARMGVDAVLGGKADAFLNLTETVFHDEMLEALPKERVVLEILETVKPGPRVAARCSALRRLGYRLALDDYVLRDPREPLLERVDLVKVDILDVGMKDLPRLVSRLRRNDVLLLAEKVEDREEFERCKQLGFDLYQGYFFSKPTVVSGKAIDPARATVLQAIEQLSADVDSEPLADTIKQNADLGLNLLRLVNSAAMGRAVNVASVAEAVAYLGRRQLRRWLTLLLFAGADSEPGSSALLQTAAVRGRLMENIVGLASRESDPHSDRQVADRAFLVGMLSLADALLGVPRTELLETMSLEPEIHAALLHGEGDLGAFLAIAEGIERLDVPEISKHLDRYELGTPELRQALLDAYVWVNGLSAEAA